MHLPLRDGHTTTLPARSPEGKQQPPVALRVGQVFVPRRVLHSGVFVPDGLRASRLVSNGAKLLWARLARYAGTRGQCFPLLSTVAADLGFSERQVQRYLAELVSGGFLRARQRGYNESNVYEFLRHPARERTRDALAHTRSRMEFVGNCPYGFRLCTDGKTVEPGPHEQRVQKTITRLRDEGRSLRQIAADLNRERRFTRNGSAWRHCYVTRVLKVAPNPVS